MSATINFKTGWLKDPADNQKFAPKTTTNQVLTDDGERLTDKITEIETNKVSKSGDTMTGPLNAPWINTGEAEDAYFQSRKFRGQGDANTYHHAVDFGYSGNNKVDFHEYGGEYNFYKNTGGKKEDGILIGKISEQGFEGNVTGNAASATKATQDSNGKVIADTYETKVDASNKYIESKSYTDSEVAKKAALSTDGFFTSKRDFANGTLITTNIDYSVDNGVAWLLELKGNSYSSLIPFDLKLQGYIYKHDANSIGMHNYSGISNGYFFDDISAFCYNGVLCFWFPTIAYWQGFSVRVTDVMTGVPKTESTNCVVSITDEAKPTEITKEISFVGKIVKSVTSDNISSQSVAYAVKAGHDVHGQNISNTYETKTDANTKLSDAKSYANTLHKNQLEGIKGISSGIEENKIWHICKWEAEGQWEGVGVNYSVVDNETTFNGILGIKFRNQATVDDSAALVKWLAASKDNSNENEQIPKAVLTKEIIDATDSEPAKAIYHLFIYVKKWCSPSITKLHETVAGSVTYTEINEYVTELIGTELQSSNTVKVAEADYANKATHDEQGQNIIATYATKDEAEGYANTVKNDLLNGAGSAYDTLKELADLIDDNTDAIDALESVAINKADKAEVSNTYETKSDANQKLTEAKGYTDTLKTNLTTGSVIPLKAGSADYAVKDNNGNVIDTTYETKTDADTKLTEVQTKLDTKADKADIEKLTECKSGYTFTMNDLSELGNIRLFGKGTQKGNQLWKHGDITFTGQKSYEIDLQPGTYTFSAEITSTDTDASTCLVYMLSGTVRSEMTRGSRASYTFTLPEYCKLMTLYASNGSTAATGDTVTFKNVMLNLGDKELPIEEYTGGPASIDNPQYPEFAGESGSIGGKVLGKNFADTSKLRYWGGNDTVERVDNGFYLKPINDENRVVVIGCDMRKGNKYTLSYDIESLGSESANDINYYLTGVDNTQIYNALISFQPLVFAPQMDIKEIAIYTSVHPNAILKITNVQVELGENATEYEAPAIEQPFTSLTPNGLRGIPLGQTIPDAIKNSPIHMSGVYWDGEQYQIADTKNENGRDVQRVGKQVLGDVVNENWSINAHASSDGISAFQLVHHNYNCIATLGICTYFSNGGEWNIGISTLKNTFWIASANVTVFKTDGVETLESFQEKLVELYNNGTPLTMYYVLETPIITDTTEEEKAQLDALVMNNPVTTFVSETYMEVIGLNNVDSWDYIDNTYVKKSESKEFVDKTSNQNIDGLKTFTDGFKLGNALFKYDYENRRIVLSFTEEGVE